MKNLNLNLNFFRTNKNTTWLLLGAGGLVVALFLAREQIKSAVCSIYRFPFCETANLGETLGSDSPVLESLDKAYYQPTLPQPKRGGGKKTSFGIMDPTVVKAQ